MDEDRSAIESSSGLTMVPHRRFDRCDFCSAPSDGPDWCGREFPLCSFCRIKWESDRSVQEGK